ncbi:MAG TPA: amidohydrolase family protein, partial [Opitutaceae bacterium]|nr:amidohydrolase family protein [Opitutaceae bacterium]
RAGAAAAAAALLPRALRAATTADDIPIIDTHIHLFDGRRPQGAPYKGGRGFKGGVALPDMYEKLARPLGIVGALEIDASPWVEDNLWVLETIQPSNFMVGTVGNLQPEKPEFTAYVERYAKNPLFRGIRYGNNWGYNLVAQADNPVFIAGLKRMAELGLVLDTANPRVDLLQAVVKVSDQVPDLTIIVDHLPSLDPTPANQAGYDAVMKELAPRPKVYTKLSEIVHPVGMRGPITPGLAAHKDRLDTIMGTFGEDRVVFGSDWPNCVGVSEVPDTVALVREYFAGRSRAAAEKYFWKNSVAAYRWIKRDPSQPSLA